MNSANLVSSPEEKFVDSRANPDNLKCEVCSPGSYSEPMKEQRCEGARGNVGVDRLSVEAVQTCVLTLLQQFWEN